MNPKLGAKFLILIAFVALVIGNGSLTKPIFAESVSTLTESSNSMQPDHLPTPEPNSCHPGSGWTWTSGPLRPEIAVLVKQELSQMGMDTVVEARAYGETDSCGTFKSFEIDFSIEVRDEDRFSQARQIQLADELYPILAKFGKPNLGNVKITSALGNTFTFNDKILADQLTALALDTGWQQASPAISPPGRYANGLAYDTLRQVAVLFGGDNTGWGRLNDTWEYDGMNWRQVIVAQSPAGRVNIDQALVYDSSRQRMILFGGQGSGTYLNDTWQFNGTTWLQSSPGTSPQARDSHAMVFDSYQGAAIMFGGFGYAGIPLNDTWQYDGTWQQVSTAQTPPGRFYHAMVYDQQRHVTILFGGKDGAGANLADTWEYDGATWRQITPSLSPSARRHHSMVYDSGRGVVVLFGGEDSSGFLNDTWEYDGITWRLVSASPAPSPRMEVSMTFDSQRGRIVSFGGGYWGDGGLTVFNDTWEYNSAVVPTPPGALNKKVYVIVYDPILSNGQYLSEYFGWNSHVALTQGTVDFFRRTSGNRMNYTVADTTIVTDRWPEKLDGFAYTEGEYLAVLRGERPRHLPEEVNYGIIVNSPEFDICGKANRGDIDEVWIYIGPYGGFWESVLVGPGAYFYNSYPVPGPHDCNRLIPIMAPNPERGLECAIENFGHRTEATMDRAYSGWPYNSTTHNWDKYTLVTALSPGYGYSGCGNIHYPPNGTSDYDYGNPSTVLSNCDDFANYPNLHEPSTVWQPVTCSLWGCAHLDFFGYWYGHLPRSTGCGIDGVANNWWRYFGEPARALNPPSACDPLEPTLSINFATGQPGSLLTVTGTDFPANSSTTVVINGNFMATSVATDLVGNLTFILDTSVAGTGRYYVTVTANPSLVLTFELDPTLPRRPQSGSASIIVVPSDIALTETICSPIAIK